MIVIFVSECEKKARGKTVSILDSFAERIGRSTWKTRMTMEGLKSVKILLSKNATRHTAVACHRVAGYSSTQLMWIVGNRKKFNHRGICPTNFTTADSIGPADNDWKFLELIKIVTAISALFHDWGKSWDAFQDMLQKKDGSDYLRHEYISLSLFSAFVNSRNFKEWMSELCEASRIDKKQDQIISRAKKFFENGSLFDMLPDPISQTIGWLIVSHHLMPDPGEELQGRYPDIPSLLKSINEKHGYIKNHINDRPELNFSRGLPLGPLWKKTVSKWAGRGIELLNIIDISHEPSFLEILRPVAHMARTALVLGDHIQSSHEDSDDNKKKEKRQKKKKSDPANTLLAKSRKSDQAPPVSLDAHLAGVAREAVGICHFYPYIENNLFYVETPASIERRSPAAFGWQDKAADYIRGKIRESGHGNRGFFGVNMASTGTGKTFGNAKIMNAVQQGRLRYTLALGLRSLTLQTGDEYKQRIGLDETEMAVVIGSAAFRELHERQLEKAPSADETDTLDIYSAWKEINYTCPVLDDKLSTKLKKNKARQILYSPVLVCTIDHIMGATEGTKRGRHILPWLRMLSSDLVIDEVDDFDGDDLVAIMRLVHLAGMLGRNVMISSATIPPAVAESAFNAYRCGWELFAIMHGRSKEVLCAWIDEFRGAKVRSIQGLDTFKKEHTGFIRYRTKKLRQQPARRRAEIQDVEKGTVGNSIIDAAFRLHNRHGEEIGDKKVSFGVIRTANITPCVAISKFLLRTDSLPENTDIRVLTYHARFPMLVRHHIEAELDRVLKRTNKDTPFRQPTIQKHIKTTDRKNLIFILVATPVEEVGRDHDFDWAILEPSSIRSLIQMSGRVLRHRNGPVNEPNVIVLNRNFNALKNETVAYTRPGYECNMFKLASHEMRELLDTETIAQSVNSTLRIARPSNPSPGKKLLDLEHCHLDKFLLEGDAKDSGTVPGWNDGPWHLSNIAQRKHPFRKGRGEQDFFLIPDSENWSLKFYRKDERGEMVVHDYWITHEEVEKKEYVRLWLPVDYFQLLEEMAEKKDLAIRQVAMRYGMVSVPYYWLSDETGRYKFSPSMGLWRQDDTIDQFLG